MAKTIKSTGPVPCDVAVVAERPGREEASRGYVLCGPSGQELDRYLLNESGLDRAGVHCCNLVRDYRDGANPEQYEVVRDWPLLVDELSHVRPRFICALGLWSTRALLGLDIEMEWANGLHFPVRWEWPFTVMPVIHTAAGLHHAPDAIKIAHGFRQFGKLVKGERLPTGHLRTGVELQDYTDNVISIGDVVAMDTEGTVDSPWGLSYSCRPGVASVEHSARKHRKWNCKNVNEALIVLHHAIHDLPVLARLGVRPRQFTDTMLMAALLGTEPLGLKALARRHVGLVMQEYDEVVAEARREKALEYLGKVLDLVKEEVNA